MIIDRISGSDNSYAVREDGQGSYSSTWWLVRDFDTKRPTVISIQGMRHVYLKSTGRLARKIVAAVKAEGSFALAVREFEAVQEAYEHFGAQDTEPRAEFAEMLIRLADGQDPQVPKAVGNEWDLYSSMHGHGLANAALTRAAKGVVKAAVRDRKGLLAYLKYNHGWEPF